MFSVSAQLFYLKLKDKLMLLKLPAMTFSLLNLRAGEHLFAFHISMQTWPLRLGCAKHSGWACSPDSSWLLFCARKFGENVCSTAQKEEPEQAAPFSVELFQFPFKWWEYFPPKQAVPAPSALGKSNLPSSLSL